MVELKENCLHKIPDSQYFGLDRISSSKLRNYEENPEQYNLKYVLKVCPDDRRGTEAMLIGAAAHCLTLEGEDEFHSRYSISPEFGRTKADMEARDQWECDHFGAIGLTEKQFKQAGYMAKAAKRHYGFQKLLDESQPLIEQTTLFKWCGLDCKAKLDMIGWRKDYPVLIDMKTTQNAEPAAFLESIDKYGYIRQMGFYAKAAGGILSTIKPDVIPSRDVEVWLFAADKGFPSRCSLYRLSENTLDRALKSNVSTLQRIKDSYAENVWESDWTKETHYL